MSNKILIEDIEREPNKTLHYEFDDEIKELEGCRLRADLEIKSLGGFIEVKGEASGVVTLECDRCLNKFEYDLLYQSVILALPNKNVCGINCNEGLFVSEEDMEIHDDRMDVFKNIKID